MWKESLKLTCQYGDLMSSSSSMLCTSDLTLPFANPLSGDSTWSCTSEKGGGSWLLAGAKCDAEAGGDCIRPESLDIAPQGDKNDSDADVKVSRTSCRRGGMYAHEDNLG